MNEPLRPLNLGEILDRTAQLYRTRFLVFLGISLLPTGVVLALAFGVGLVVAWWSWAGAGSISEAAGYVLVAVFAIAITLVALPIYLAAAALAAAAMNHAVSRMNLGEKTTIRDAYKTVWMRGWRYIGLYLLLALIIGIAPMVVWFSLVIVGGVLAKAASMGGSESGFLFGLAAILLVVVLLGYAIWMLLRLALAFPACVVEQIGAWPAVKRSSVLTKGTKGRIFLLYLLVAILGWIISMAITFPLTILLALLPGMSNPQHAQTMGLVMLFIIYGASFAVQTLIRPVYGIALVLFYYDQRIRLEGFDIEWMMQQAGMAPAPPPVPEAAPWLPSAPSKAQTMEENQP
ncbi:MAG: hypothetical protein ACLQGT_05735 [Terracidiphilus sp.]